MATKKVDFADVLQKCEAVVKQMGLVIQYTHNLDPFFKGDLDGKIILAPLLVFSPTVISKFIQKIILHCYGYKKG